jgi:serine/threonine protein kinase
MTIADPEHRRSSRLVAIKILRADESTKSDEVTFHQDFQARCLDENAKVLLVSPIDNFWEAGIDGQHQCLVFEPMAYDAWDCISFTPRDDPQELKFRHANARVITRDLLLALHSLHSCGIVHGYPSVCNMLADFESDPTQKIRTLVHADLGQVADAAPFGAIDTSRRSRRLLDTQKFVSAHAVARHIDGMDQQDPKDEARGFRHM